MKLKGDSNYEAFFERKLRIMMGLRALSLLLTFISCHMISTKVHVQEKEISDIINLQACLTWRAQHMKN